MIDKKPAFGETSPELIISRRRENQLKASMKYGVNYTETMSTEELDRLKEESR